MSERLSPTKREQPEGNEGPPCSDLLGFSFGSRLPSRPPASLELVTASPASQPHTRWTGLGRASGALLLLSAPPSPRVSRAAETPRLTSLPPPGRSLRGERGAARSYLRRGTPPRRLPAVWGGGCSMLGKALLQVASWGMAGRQKNVQEKEARRKGGGETRLQRLCQPHASPGTPFPTLWQCYRAPQTPVGSGRLWGSAPASCTPGHTPCHGEAKPDPPPRRVQGQDGEVGAAPWHHVSGRKRGVCVCGGVVFTAPSTEPKFTPCQALAESGALHRCCRIISPCPAHRRQGCSWAEAVLGAEHPPPCRWW